MDIITWVDSVCLCLGGSELVSESLPVKRFKKSRFCSLFADFIPHRTVFQQTA